MAGSIRKLVGHYSLIGDIWNEQRFRGRSNRDIEWRLEAYQNKVYRDYKDDMKNVFFYVILPEATNELKKAVELARR